MPRSGLGRSCKLLISSLLPESTCRAGTSSSGRLPYLDETTGSTMVGCLPALPVNTQRRMVQSGTRGVSRVKETIFGDS